MARIFLYLCAFVIATVIAIAVAWRLYPDWFMRMALEPTEEFQAPPAAPQLTWADPKLWIARPGMADTNPALWTPRIGDVAEGGGEPPARFVDPAPRGGAAIFYVHPTSLLSRAHWNAGFDDREANWRAGLFTRGQASVFSGVGDVWAPHYRQAAIGAFLTRDTATANRALLSAYADVVMAWRQFLEEAGPDRPIIIAGHSQGALHLSRLLRLEIAGKPVARRIAAAYVIGWPISVAHDLPMMGLPACATADSSNCILGWQSFAEPADYEQVTSVYDATIGFDGERRTGSRMLCVNPLSGTLDGTAERSANIGTVRQDSNLRDGQLLPGAVGAQCDDPDNGGRGFLLIGDGPDLGGFILPGNNYHVYDYSLFWANIRMDARRRLAAFQAAQ